MTRTAVLNTKAIRRLQAGHPWIYQSDIIRLPEDRVGAGIVEMVDQRGGFYGRALFSPASQITLRRMTGASEKRVMVDGALIHDRIQAAWTRRRQIYGDDTTYRLLHGEADLLPGVFVDRYGDSFVLQSTCGGADTLVDDVVRSLVRLFSPRVIVRRNDAKTRAKEGLPQGIDVGCREHDYLFQPIEALDRDGGSAQPRPAILAQYREGSITYEVDLLGDQKTGGFLDQRANHVMVRRYTRPGRALDCCTYHGGFALQMASAGDDVEVLACDLSSKALERAQANADRAGLSNVSFVRADVFALLPELIAKGDRFDTIVLDPPAFASTQHTLERAQRAYKEINLRAMKLLNPGGVLVTCSCSGRVRPDEFDAMLADAARDAGRSMHMLERLAAGPDHPVLLGVPETDYLKCRVLMAV